VRDLVRDRLEDVAPGERRRVLVDEEASPLERDRAPVLHRAERRLGDGDEVELGERVGDAVVLLVRREDLADRFEREPTGLGLAGGREHPEHDAPRPVLEPVEASDAEIEQVG
jgi:hypothetical protein